MCMKDSFSYMFMGSDFKRQRTVFIVKFIANVFTFAWQAEDEDDQRGKPEEKAAESCKNVC